MPDPDLNDDLSLLTEAAREAGKIALHYFKRDPDTWDKGDGAGPVTQADLEIDQMLRQSLTAARPDYGWLSEETEDDLDRLSKDTVFIVDPIDGTRAFIDGQSAFSHSLAVVHRGAPVAAVVHLPAQDRLFAAAVGLGATLNGAQIVASDPAREADATVLATRASLHADHWPGGVPVFNRSYRPSLAYRMALVGTGRHDCMLTFRQTWEWDIAAGALIAAEGGATVTDAKGGRLSLNGAIPQVDGVLAAGARLHAALLARRSA